MMPSTPRVRHRGKSGFYHVLGKLNEFKHLAALQNGPAQYAVQHNVLTQ
jgi:hypothetical protein